jgi:hypothetical protein
MLWLVWLRAPFTELLLLFDLAAGKLQAPHHDGRNQHYVGCAGGYYEPLDGDPERVPHVIRDGHPRRRAHERCTGWRWMRLAN